jgi:hypothetical protein
LQVLECYAEDELYRDFGTEIELIERLIRTEEVESPEENNEESRIGTVMTVKEAVRYSIFTIDEEQED